MEHRKGMVLVSDGNRGGQGTMEALEDKRKGVVESKF